MNAVKNCTAVITGTVLFVLHEASRTGAPMFLLHLLRWLKRETPQQFEILIRQKGPLTDDFAALCSVHDQAWFEEAPERFGRYSLIYANTICNGLFLGQFSLGQVPVITHVHELEYGIDANGARNMAQVMRQTDHYIVCAMAVKEQLIRRFRIEPERISTHYEIFDPKQVDTNVLKQSTEAVRHSFNIRPDALVIAACGTVDQRKGADLFVQLAARVQRLWQGPNPLHFLWIGKINDLGFSQILRHDIRRLGMRERISLVGEQSNPHALIGVSDIFCLTSREDPFPLVMLEATALAKPLVCFEGSGGASELCAYGAGTAVPFLDVTEMATYCLSLLTDESRRRSAGQLAATIVRSRYTPEIVAPALWLEVADILNQLVSTSRSSKAKHSIAEIYKRWPIEDMPEPVYVRHSLKCAELRETAQAFARTGRHREAIAALLKAVGVAMESKDGRIVLESLIEFSRDMAPINASGAATLLTQAEQLLPNVKLTPQLANIYQRDLTKAKTWLRDIDRNRGEKTA